MEIWIQDLSLANCYTRFGKVIPKKETKIDMIKYFGKDVLNELKADPRIKVVVHNSVNLEAEKKEATQKESEVDLFHKAEEERIKTVKVNRKK